jgi:flagellar hook-associated protein 3 FlgL
MRITFNTQYRESSLAVDRTSEQLLEAQRRVASGKRMGGISDDPGGAAASIAERSSLSQTGQYTRAADSVSSRLMIVDGVLSDMVEALTTARTVATGARGDTKTTAERDAAAQALRGVRDALADGLNTSFNGVYLFAGAASTTRPYVVPGGGTVHAYNGSNDEVQLDIGDGRAATIAFDGEAITRGGDAQDVFDTIDALITAVEAGDDAAIGVGLAGLARAFDRAIAAQSRVGTDMQVVDTQKARLEEMRLSGTTRLSSLEDANMAEAITRMNQAELTYRAALGAISTVARVSLLDYLK